MRLEDARRSDRRIARPSHSAAAGDTCTQPHRRWHLVLVAFVIGLIALWSGQAAAQFCASSGGGGGVEMLCSTITGTLPTSSFQQDANFISNFDDAFNVTALYNSASETGVTFGGDISGGFGLDFLADTGAASANFSIAPQVQFNLINGFGQATSNLESTNGNPQTFTLHMTNTTATPSLSSANGPQLGFSVNLLTKASASLNGSACVIGICASGSTNLFSYNYATPGSSTSNGNGLPILSYDTNSGQLSLFGVVNVPSSLITSNVTSPFSIGYDPTAEKFSINTNNELTGDSEDNIPLGTYIQLLSSTIDPTLTLQPQTSQTPNVLTSSNNQVLGTNLDLTGIVGAALSAATEIPINPFEPAVTIGPLSIYGTLLSVTQGMNWGVTDTETLNTGANVTLQTNQPVDWSQTINGITNVLNDSTSFTASTAATVSITTNSTTPVALLPTVLPTATLTNQTSMNINGTLTVSGPGLSIYYNNTDLYDTPDDTLYTDNEGQLTLASSTPVVENVASSLLPGIQGPSISNDPAKTVLVNVPNTTYTSQLIGAVSIGSVSGNLQVASGSNAMNNTALTIQSGGTMELCPSTVSCVPLPRGQTPGPVAFDTPALTVASGGTLLVDSGATLKITDPTSSTDGFTNASGILAGLGTLQGGTYVIAGTLDYQGNDISYIEPGTSLTLNGSGTLQNGTFNGTSFSNGHNALQSLEGNGGTLVVGGGASLTVGGMFNSGALQVTGNSTLSVGYLENLSGGTLQLTSGSVLNVRGGSGYFFNLNNGSLSVGSYDIESGSRLVEADQITNIAAATTVTLGGEQPGLFFANSASSDNFSNDMLSYLTSNNGTLTLQTGAQQYLFASGTLSAGLSTVYGSGNIPQTFTNNGTLNILPGTNSNNPGCGSSQSCLHVSGNFVNASGGTLTISGGALNVGLVDTGATGTVNFTNNGTLVLSNQIVNGETVDGTLTVSGTLGNFGNSCGGSSGCTLTGGNWTIGGTLNYDTSYNGETGDTVIQRIGSGTVFTLAGGTISGGLDHVTENDGTLNIQDEAVGTTFENSPKFTTNTGLLTITGTGGALYASTSLSNTGSISIGKNANLYIGVTGATSDSNAAYVARWGSYNIGTSTLSNIGAVTVTGQLDFGGGTISTLGSGSNLTLDGSNGGISLMYYSSNGASGDALTGHLQTVASGATLNLTNGYGFVGTNSLSLNTGSKFTTDATSFLQMNDGTTLTIGTDATSGVTPYVVTNAGSIVLDGTSSGTTLTIGAAGQSGNVTLTGGGNVGMTYDNKNTISITSGVTLVNVDNTISGSGTITGALSNQGKINAGGATTTLTIENPLTNTITNSGTISSAGSGTQTTYADGTAVQYNSSGQAECENQANCSSGGVPTNLVTKTAPSNLLLQGGFFTSLVVQNFSGSKQGTIDAESNVTLLYTTVNGGYVDVGAPSTTVSGGTVSGAGGGTLLISGTTVHGGTLNNYTGGLVITGAGYTSTLGGIINNDMGAEIQVTLGSTLNIESTATFANNGLIDLVPSIEGAQLLGGSVSNAGTINVADNSGSVTITTAIANTSAGLLNVDAGAHANYTGNLSNAGLITIGGQNGTNGVNSAGSKLAVSGAITQTAGETVVSVGSLSFGSFALNGGTMLLQSTNGATGAVTVNGGTMQIAANQSLGAALVLQNGSITGGDNTADNFTTGSLTATSIDLQKGTVSAILAGSETITKDTTNTVTLSGANTFTGALNINAGVLQISAANNMGNGTGASFGGGTLEATSGSFSLAQAITLNAGGGTVQADTGSTLTLANAIGGQGALTSTGAGTLVLSGTNTYSGGTTVKAGTLQLGASGVLPGTGTVAVNGGTFDVHGFTQTIGVLTGTGGTVALGTGTLTTTIAGSDTLASQITGTGTLVVQGGGTLTLTYGNNYLSSANTTVNGSTLSLGTTGIPLPGGTLTLAGGTLVTTNSGTLFLASKVSLGAGGGTIDNTAGLTFDSAITGSGGLTQSGSGTTTLLSTGNTYSGGTTITAGTLQAGAGGVLPNTGAVAVNGGTFSLNGFNQTIGDLTGTGGTLALGSAGLTVNAANSDTLASQVTGTGTLTMQGSGSLALTSTNNSAASFNTNVNTGTLRIGAAGDLGTGRLTLGGGTLEVTSGSFTLGNSVIVNGSGGTVQTDSGTTLTLSQSVNSSGLFTKTGAGTLALAGANNLGNSAINGGVLQISATDNLASDGGQLSFGGGTLEVTSGSFTLGQFVTLNTSTDTIQTDNGVVLTQGQPIIGSGTLNKTGTGTLKLAPNNSYTGGTVLDGGTAQIAGQAALGNGGTVTLAGGTLEVTSGTFTLAHAIALNAVTDTVQVDSGASMTLSQAISGGALTKTGTGTLTLGASNSYTGGTAIDAGVVRITAANQLGSGTIGLAGGTLDQNGGTPALGNAIALNTGGGTIQSDNSTLTLNGTITGTGGLTIAGAGTVALGNGVALPATALTVSGKFQLDDTNQTVGAVTLNGGTISSSNGGTLSGSGVDLQNGTVSAILAGSGAVTKDTSGTVTLSGANTYSGGTTVTAGTLTLGANSVLSATGAVAVNGGTLNVNGKTQAIGDLSGTGGTLALGTGSLTEGTGNNTSLAAQVTGSGTLVKQGGGTLTLGDSGNGGANFKTTVNAGTVSIGAAGDLGTGTLTLAGGALAVTGTTALGNAVSLGAGGGTINNSAALTLNGAITGSGGLKQAGSAATILNHAGNSFSGGTTVTSGTLQLGASGALAATGAVTVNSGTFDVHGFTQTVGDLSGTGGTVALGGGTLTEGTGNSTALASAVTGLGTLIKTGTGTLTLAGNNAGQGFATTVNQGVLQFGASNALGGGAVSVGANGTVTLAATTQSASSVSDSGAISVGGGQLNGGVTINSGGQFSGFGTLNGAVTNSGLLTASGGTLRLTGAISDPDGSVTVAPNSTLDLSGSSGASQATVLTQNGTLILNSSGMTVSQDYTNANFGTGNTFNKAANVSGGPIDATGNVAQAIVAGSATAAGQVTNGTGSTATLSVGNVHVGNSVTANYQIANTGSSGPALRGTVQTTGNDANISDSRLSGSGISAASSFGLAGGDLGPVDAGSSSGDLSVTFTGTTAGALTGQAVHIANNFANVGEQTLDITGAAYRLATANVSPTTLSLGTFHVGGTATASIAVANTATADGYSESLGITGVSASGTGLAANNALGGGLIAAGGSDTSAVGVTLSNIQAGAQNDSVTVNLDSDGTGTSGLGTTALASQNVSVNATGYRLATTHLASTTLNFGAARVGDTAPTQSLIYSNTQVADGYSEGLTVTQGTLPAAYTGALGTSNLAAGQQTTGTLALQTTTSGDFSGQTVSLAVASTGATTSGLGDTALSNVAVTLNGQVYQTAQAQATSDVDFGVVHRNQVVPTQAITVTNVATGALVDQLRGGFGTVSGPFTGSGALAGVAGNGGTNSTSLRLGIQTGTVGSQSGTAQLALSSHDAALSDVAVTTQSVMLQGQVNDYAKPVLTKLSGDGQFSGANNNYALSFAYRPGEDFGAELSLANVLSYADSEAAYTDSLLGSFSVVSGGGFSFSGLGAINSLTAGGSDDDLDVAFDAAHAVDGLASEELEFNGVSYNSSGDTDLTPVFLTLIATSNVDEPDDRLVLGVGLLGLGAIRTTRRRRAAARRCRPDAALDVAA